MWLTYLDTPRSCTGPTKNHVSIGIHITIVSSRLRLVGVVACIQRFNQLGTYRREVLGLNQEVAIGIKIQVFQWALLPAVGKDAACRIVRQA